MKLGLTFDDVLLLPMYSDIASRKEVSLYSEVAPWLKLDLPIISANMDTVTGPAMANSMSLNGGLGILHRYASEDEVIDWIRRIQFTDRRVPSIGIQPGDYEKALRYREAGATAICIDVAHGNNYLVYDMVEKLKNKDIPVIVGNIATKESAKRFANMGADVIKVGIGPGSLCTTRIVTGVGVPQLTAIMECVEGAYAGRRRAGIIADGGIKNSGDIVKALAAGADAVMLGSLLAGHDECPLVNGELSYRGMASSEAQMSFRGNVSNDAPEGVSKKSIPSRGKVSNTLSILAGGIRSGFSYLGARDIHELRKNAEFIQITSNGTRENGPHGL